MKSDASTLFSAAFIVAAIAAAVFAGSATATLYALSFWHYLLYALAYVFGAAPHAVLKRDAVLMKAAALAAFAWAYFTAPLDLPSLVVSALGFLLNASGARALGVDRTYYGHEVAGLPPARITAFPYSVIPHPMLLGNVVAFGGTLLNTEFRDAWWPLATAHVALNLGLLAMEVAVKPRLGNTAGPSAPAIGAGLCVAGLGCLGVRSLPTLPGAILSAAILAYACALYGCYAAPVSRASAKGPP